MMFTSIICNDYMDECELQCSRDKNDGIILSYTNNLDYETINNMQIMLQIYSPYE
jgi:hypothetical protein